MFIHIRVYIRLSLFIGYRKDRCISFNVRSNRPMIWKPFLKWQRIRDRTKQAVIVLQTVSLLGTILEGEIRERIIVIPIYGIAVVKFVITVASQ